MTNDVQNNSVEESVTTESGSGHVGLNKNYVTSSTVTSNTNGIDSSESTPCHVEVKTNDIIDSGSSRIKMKKKIVNELIDEGKVTVKLSKNAYVLTSRTPAPDENHLDVAESCNSTSSHCVDVEIRQNNNAVPDGERLASEQRETRRQSVGRHSSPPMKPADVNCSLHGPVTDSQPASINDRVLSANCDVYSAEPAHVSTRLALASLSADTKPNSSPPGDDVAARTKNGESAVDGKFFIVGNLDFEGSETGRQQQQINCRLVSGDLATVHKEGDAADRSVNCQLISTKLTSDNLSVVNSDITESDRRTNCQPTLNNLPKNCSEGNEADQKNTNSQLQAAPSEGSETDGHRVTNCHSPAVWTEGDETEQNINNHLSTAHREGGEADRLRRHADRTSNSSSLPKTRSEGSETDRCRKINRQMLKLECKGDETEYGRQRHIGCRPAAVHKRQMLVDCDISMPHSVCTSVVRQNSSVCDDNQLTCTDDNQHTCTDSQHTCTQCAPCSVKHSSANEV